MNVDLLKEAKKRYPIGTVVPSKNDWNFVYTVE